MPDNTDKDKNHIWWVSIPLFYSAFYLLGYLFQPLTDKQLVPYFLAYVIFLGLYFAAHYHRGYTHYYLIANGLLVVAISPLAFSSYALLWHTGFFAGNAFSPVRGRLMLAFLISCVLLAASLIHSNVNAFLLSALLPLVSLYVLGIVVKRINTEQKIKAQKDQQIETLAKIAERERIARDMHDVLGHSLTSITLKAQLAEKLCQQQQWQAAEKEIKEVHSLCRSSLNDLRQAIDQQKHLSFNEQLEKLCGQLRDHGLLVELKLQALPALAEHESALVLICTEACTNVLRHSAATKVQITTQQNSTKNNCDFVLSISDNGDIKHFSEGNGIRGMRERVQALKGEFKLTTDSGMHIHVCLPAPKTS
ncbi:sensor histidine kinase [Agaribacterium haliotis]|uniref:sensor histidine kinase n=1 Tax=Agaribacterium haliotis TaxID=2013869 RepID=UPI000BB52FA1|nr:sensor histidine kinase [Agaribacterium haliotis]